MKKFLFIAVMALMSFAASAQKPETGTISVLPRVGVGASIFSDFYIGRVGLVDNDKVSSNMSFAIGAEVQYQINNFLALSAGLDYDQYMSAQTKYNNEDITVKLNYLQIPVLAHLCLGERFAIEAGVQPGYLLSAKCGSYKLEGVNKFAMSVPVGLTYTFGDAYVVGVRYNFPVTKVYDFEGQNPKASAVMATFAYRFDL